MDFIGLPKAEGYSSLLVVINYLSKYACFICLKHPYSAQTVAAVFVKEIVRLHGSLIGFSLVIFVRNYSDCKGLCSNTVPPTILKLMGKAKSLIAVWKLIFVAFPLKNIASGLNGSLGLSYGTILLTIQPLVVLPSRRSMVVTLRPY